MGVIYWAPLLHFYQPPMQIPEVLRKVVIESYRPLIEVFTQYPHAKVTVNINGVLTEMLFESGFTDVIEGLRILAERGQLEFVGSGKYHPILPLIPDAEMRRQIRRNYLTNRHFFGDVYQPRGFFPPEMGYGPNIIGPILDAGHEWIIMSGVACPVAWPMDIIHEIAYGDDTLAVFFRDDVLSNKISFQDINGRGFVEHLHRLSANSGRDIYVVTAMDAETFGHHIENWDRLFLAEVYEALTPARASLAAIRQPVALGERHRDLLTMPERREELGEVQIVTISELLKRFPRGQRIEPKPASWSTTAEDIAAGNPYPLWKGPNNYIHKLQWQYIDLLLRLLYKAQEVADNPESRRFAEIARALMDPALHSCQMWWASRRPHWDVNMVHRGTLQGREVILNAFRAINQSGAPEEIKREAYYQVVAARDLADKIQDQLFW